MLHNLLNYLLVCLRVREQVEYLLGQGSMNTLKKLFIICLKIIMQLPLISFLLKRIYLKANKKVAAHFKMHESVVDIILTSQLDSKSFIYGQSDLNYLVIVNNESHPKVILNEFRNFLNSDFLLKLLIQSQYIPILTVNELNTDVIKSFLFRKSTQDLVQWNSILTDKSYQFFLRKQDIFAMTYNSVQNLDYNLLYLNQKRSTRSQTKNTYEAIHNLAKFHKKIFPVNLTKYQALAQRIQNYPFLKHLFLNQFKKKTWDILTKEELPQNKSTITDRSFILPKEFRSFLKSLLNLEFIDDFTLTPSIIQKDQESFTGKLYIEVHLNQLVVPKYISQLENIRAGIQAFETQNLKFRVRFTSATIYQLQYENAYFPYPLESLYRKEKTISMAKRKYDFLISHDHLIMASIHFLIIQFMRFRSLQQKSDLIGSKFIKSINLMYRYYLVSQFLKGQSVEFLNHERKIREFLTPQFSEIKSGDIVSEEDWKLIRAQMLYLLKDIRDELLKYDSSLKLLRF